MRDLDSAAVNALQSGIVMTRILAWFEARILDAEAVDAPYIQEAILMEAGVLHVTVLFPLRSGAPDEAKSPGPITVIEDGPN
jgi:hypothetical protein